MNEEIVAMGQDIVRLAFQSLSAPRMAAWLRAPLFGAVRDGNERLATLLLQAVSGDEVFTKTYGERQHRLVHAAALGGNVNIFKAVLAKRKETGVSNSTCDVGARDVVGRTPMHLAAMRGNAAVVRALLRAGGQAEVVDVLGRTPLHIACELGHEELATDLLFRGAKVGTRDTDGLTPLHLAARGGQTSALGFLLRAFADPEERTPPSLLFGGGLSALDLATNNGKIETMAHLLADGGCDVNGRDPVTDTTALHHAAGNHHHGEAAMKVLLKAGASVGAVSKTHGTPLHRAVSVGFLGGVRALLRAGGDENATDEQSGETPLSMLERHQPQGLVTRVGARGRVAGTSEIPAAAALEVKRLLVRAPVDRAWRRRGWLVMLRARELSASAATAMTVVAEAPALQVEIKKEEGRRRKIQRQGRQGMGLEQAKTVGSPAEAETGSKARWSNPAAPVNWEGKRSFLGAVHLLLDLTEPDVFKAVVLFL